MKKTLTNISLSEKGFTIVEILVAVAISGIVMAGIYSAYYSQQRSYETQEKVVAIQQNLRAAMYFMEREIRMAGLDPVRTGLFGIITPSSDSLQFSEDISDDPGDDDDGDGDYDDEPDGILQGREDITYAITGSNLTRTAGAGPQTIAENIEALNFIYLDAGGSVIADPVTNINDIASVQIAIVARSEKPDPKYTSTQTFSNMQGDTIGSYADHYRRELLTAQVKCRNIGLE